jgi:hypothetical protein
MAEKNPFDLEGRGGPERKHPARVWTPEEQAEKLTGYIEITPKYWELIRYGTHVRYITAAGDFRPGGFVLKNPFDTKPRGGHVEKRFLKLQNGFNEKVQGYQQWVVAYEDLAKVYVKPDAAAMMQRDDLMAVTNNLNENIRLLSAYAKRLDARIAALEQHKHQ